ncbi:MAG: hypothetical protein MJA82_06490 [Clostridia bacterium]|nr:hypothetical protein [Clostridia bacterium]
MRRYSRYLIIGILIIGIAVFGIVNYYKSSVEICECSCQHCKCSTTRVPKDECVCCCESCNCDCPTSTKSIEN